jgi:hypothetical protein
LGVVSNDTITVSAVVPPSFTMSWPGNTDAFTTNLVSTGDTTTTGVTPTVSTNAANGWILWADDSQAGLHSTTASHTIATVATGSNANFTTGVGTEQYGLGVTAAGTGAPTANYTDLVGHHGGGLSTSQFFQIATGAAPVSANGVTIKELANITSTTQAAQDYKDIITVVGAGSF